MIDATTAATPGGQPDPTLATLVPQRSVRRNLLLSVAALLVLVGAWLSPHLLRSAVFAGSNGGESNAIAPRQVVSVTQLAPDGWPFVTVQSVDDVPGATVTGAWLLPEASRETDRPIDSSQYSSGLDYLRAAFPHADLGSASRLPQRLGLGETADLVVLSEITNCSLLNTGQGPVVKLRRALGTTTSEQGPEWAGPGSHLETLREIGACPGP
jgi:hypothetical protein